ncbi:MAG: hypothetical protein FD156_179 [Nitrospirae bacterium]|nr:MAG: hypothetical protein FD156_179 [Nitrospirota bacterium]
MAKNKKDSDSEEQSQNTNIVFGERDSESDSLYMELSNTQTKELIEYGVEKNNETSRARRNNDDTLISSHKGSSPQGEANTLPTCVTLVQALNEAGENWSHPIDNTEKDDNVDCIAYDKDNNKKELHIQVVRAKSDKNFWRHLAKKGQIEQEVSINELLTDLKLSIEKKSEIPPPQRQHLVLALDATKLPVFIFDDVLKEYILRYGAWTHSLGFQSVWLVGPLSTNTKRLDIKSSL